MISTDIVIVGGGSVGLTTALGLANTGFTVTVIDNSAAETILSSPETRVSALSPASEAILRNLEVWQHLDCTRLTPYSDMDVWEKDSFGRINFNAEQVSEPRLGHIIENANIRNALINTAQQHHKITLLFETKYQTIHNSDEHVLVTLENGAPILAKLLIAADGANSNIRKLLKLPITFSDYDHHAIVATIKTTEPHTHCARQVFLPEGPLALLPLYNSNLCSIVWSTSPENAEKLMADNDEQFSRALTAATDSVLGPVSLHSKRQSFPLTMRYANQWLDKRVVLVGDAAHTIHPLAGLGMNLGLLDAASLLQQLQSVDVANLPEMTQQLRSYERWRKAEAQQVILAMQSLKSLFEGNNPIKKLIRTAGLSMTNSMPMVKHEIILNAMGMKGNLPTLAVPVEII
ncbi:FAD-dependent monooxygenase [Psychrosphaera sp. 1_MG-2023]|uniref:FAD-dependent monooxygenase n=1 Tax=Psychrosphaera sp. 1_MG-2023 TaxID=3062643 RepID=UPI0026E43802|nr:FAD-dependent monooxygenase [Psychrosphaera sp. 1_MG-2023]MDO6720780.1 FAD-dependent monooxygenase [Psychrosphaera sp. 1_MG-2023]